MFSKRTAAKTEDEAVAQYVRTLAPDSSLSVDDDVVQRAQEFNRLMKNYARDLAALKPTPQLKFVTACFLAYESLGKHVSKESAINASGVPAKLFDSFRAFAGKLLKVGSKISIKDVAIRLGLDECILSATALLSEFNAAYGDMYEGVPEDQAIAVAIFVCAVRMGLPSHKQELIALSKLKKVGFELLVGQMVPFYCQVSGESSTARRQNASAQKGKNRKRKHAESSQMDELEPSSSTSKENELEADSVDLPNENEKLSKDSILRSAFDSLKELDPAKYKVLVSKYKSKLPEGFVT